MALHYEHSYLFQNLKQIKETISDNYSSSQYIDVLDKLLFKALRPIILNTNYLDKFLVELMHLAILNHRRKISNLSRESFITYVFTYLISDKTTKYKIFKKMKLERTFVSFVVNSFINELKDYYDISIKCTQGDKESKIRKTMMEKNVFLLEGYSLWNVITEVSLYLNESQKFKKQIVEKYVRHILVAAQTHYKMNNSKMELDEIIQTMFVFASHAIDKYDQSKGTLTSYISTWLQHARNQSSVNELETSFVLPHAKRNELKNASVSLDSIENLEIEIEEDNYDIVKVRQLAKLADPTGFARIAMDIQECLSRDEINLQKQCVLF